MDRHVKESLAGRVSYFDLNTLTVSEIVAAEKTPIQQILYQGGWPELYAVEGQVAREYLDNYISSYIEKDIVLSAGIQKRREFLRFIQLLAGRVGSLLDYASLGRDAGVEANTIKDWISILEQMHIIAFGFTLPVKSVISASKGTEGLFFGYRISLSTAGVDITKPYFDLTTTGRPF